MRIWHVGSSGSPNLVNGVNAMVWTLARAQVSAGYEVCVVSSDPPDLSGAAAQMGVTVVHIPCNAMRFDPAVLAAKLAACPPDVVHLHSVFVHALTTLAWTLRRKKIPYVVTVHGGLAPQVLRRRPIRKALYSALFERSRLRHAGAISFVGPGEPAQFQAFVPNYNGHTQLIPNPVDPESLSGRFWRPPTGRPQLVFLGRFDVHGKGIDLLVEVARRLPEADLHLYGTEDPRSRRELQNLQRQATPNVFFHDPVYDAQKAAVLSEASLYLQLSRWEGFPVAVTEAMCLGTPFAINQDLAIAPLVRDHELGLLVPDDAAAAAGLIKSALADVPRLQAWSVNGRAYAAEHLRPDKAAAEYARLYRQVCSTASTVSPIAGRAGADNGAGR